MILLSAPTIGRLFGRKRVRGWKCLVRGDFGPVIYVGRRPYATLSGVEAPAGQRFTADQLALAADGIPGRILTIPEEIA